MDNYMVYNHLDIDMKVRARAGSNIHDFCIDLARLQGNLRCNIKGFFNGICIEVTGNESIDDLRRQYTEKQELLFNSCFIKKG